MANILCLDFDDTIVLDNTLRQLLGRFGTVSDEEHAALVDEPRRRGELTVEQGNIRSLECIDAEVSDADLAAYVIEVARPRAGLQELCDWALWNEWLVVCVSLGFDIYVNPVLDSLGLDRVARHVGRTSRAYKRQLRYDSPRGIQVESGFKVSYARAFKDAGDYVVYFGDGESDIDAARLAPVVFARSTLLERLAGEREGVYPFETFDDAITVLDKEAEGWLRSFSSTTAAAG